MLPDRILLVDRSPKLVNAWTEAFEDFPFVSVLEADLFSYPADAMLSPANSFGIMDGGVDRAIRDTLGFEVQDRLQRLILERHHGELPVGAAAVVRTMHATWPYLVAAPTMRVPESIAQTINAYLAFRAALLAIRAFNEASGKRSIGSLLCPGLRTGTGLLGSRRCADPPR